MECDEDSLEHVSLKIILVGNAGVGKSSIVERYSSNHFIPKYHPTVGVDLHVTKATVNNTNVLVNIYDLSGEPAYSEVRNELYADADAIVFVFDVIDPSSFEGLDEWVAEINQELDCDSYLRVHVVNKVDCNNSITNTKEQHSDFQQYKYFETSASTGQGIHEMFQYVIQAIIVRHVPTLK